jgi:hypothetical protein
MRGRLIFALFFTQLAALSMTGCVSAPYWTRLVITNMSQDPIEVMTSHTGEKIILPQGTRRPLKHSDGTVTVSVEGKAVARYSPLSPLSCPDRFVSTWSLPWAKYRDLWVTWGDDGQLYMTPPGKPDYRGEDVLRVPAEGSGTPGSKAGEDQRVPAQ